VTILVVALVFAEIFSMTHLEGLRVASLTCLAFGFGLLIVYIKEQVEYVVKRRRNSKVTVP